MFQGRHLTVNSGGAYVLTQTQSAVLIQYFNREAMDRGIPPHPLEVGKVILLGGYSPLVAHKGEIPRLKILQGERLNGCRWRKAFLGFLPSINQALLCFLLVFAVLQDSKRWCRWHPGMSSTIYLPVYRDLSLIVPSFTFLSSNHVR